ncbi:DNA excision repair protein ERCC-6-like [Lycorma delicatula]|uniref:DNA excision repair protein ERCC-6-like n=1 Tax=Lycorma delicatula TaxID=130591 RepID=UPI003F5112E4
MSQNLNQEFDLNNLTQKGTSLCGNVRIKIEDTLPLEEIIKDVPLFDMNLELNNDLESVETGMILEQMFNMEEDYTINEESGLNVMKNGNKHDGISIKEEFLSIDDIKDKTMDSVLSTLMNDDIKTDEFSEIDRESNIHSIKSEAIELELGEAVEENGMMGSNSQERSAFLVDRSVIPSVAKSDQATELQNISGISVYSQDVLEAGILKQVDDALEGEINPSIEAVEGSAFDINNFGTKETDMERSIRLGEMTPFGTILNGSSDSKKKKNLELSILEKYMEKQAEFDKKHKDDCVNSKSNSKKIINKDPLKRRALNRDGKKKKHRIKESIGTETKESVSANEKPGAVPGERNHVYLNDATDSEYVPSESELESSEDDKRWSNGKITLKNPVKSRKKKSLSNWKIPEDWRSDDSDWASSDEERKKKRRRNKKKLDDGDIELYKLRIEEWGKNNKMSKDYEKFHKFDGDFKVPQHVWDKLYNYQKVGVRWLWELDRQRCGGILGDEMGLGKTVQVISFLYGLHCSELKDKDTGYCGLGPSLIICPTTLMQQWVNEFHTWFPHLRVAILHESGTYGKNRVELVRKIYTSGNGVLVLSYTGAVQHKDQLTSRTWHYVILDEGHKIRNPDAQVTLALKQLKTSHRIILTGSPMQNNLRELWSLFDFIFPGKLGTLPVFLEQFAVPITQGGYANASEVQVITAYKCATVLKDTIAPYLLRRLKSDVKSHIRLPDKNEQVLFCKLTDEQRDLYKGYVDSGEVSRILDGRLQIFVGLISLRKICNHPDLYSGGPKLFSGESEEKLPENERYGHWSKAGKMIVIETLLKIWKKQGHRVLLFTQGQQMLCIMEAFVKQSGYKYLKLDGSTSIGSRQPLINKFNQDTSYFVMILTTRVGGLGVNLTGADRVVIYDPDWNPATDTQARERAWRIGQKQNVTVYRLITAGTIEEKMYHRQIFKQFLTNKVLKDPRQRRFFKSNDLFELFTLKETNTEGSTETSAIFAGTNSEVKLDPSKSYHIHKKQKFMEPKSEAEKPNVTFSKKKIELMKKLAQKLSMNIGKKIEGNCTVTSNSLINNEKAPNEIDSDVEKNTSKSNDPDDRINITIDDSMNKLEILSSSDLTNNNCSKDFKNQSSNNNCISLENDSVESRCSIMCTEKKTEKDSEKSDFASSNKEADDATSSYGKHNSVLDKNDLKDKQHRHKKRKDKKHNKFAKFEGETVPHLLKQRTASTKATDENEEVKSIATQDEYVLKKLFDKSGLQTAMKHDTIMEGGPADYALVEGEADKVASKAVAALKDSRRDCNRATSGLPTFTGSNGFLKRSKIKFNGKVSKPGSSEGTVSSNSLLQKIKHRNLDGSIEDGEVELLRDMRDFVSGQGGTTTTDKLISEFKDRLPIGKSPVFKALLSKICIFYRAPDSKGYWTLRDDYL